MTPVPEPVLFLHDLWALDHALRRLTRRPGARNGVSGSQRLLLRVIGRHPECSPGLAARILHLHPATVTRLSAGLERRGLVRRDPDPGDARRLRLRLTRQGEQVCGSEDATIELALKEALAAAPPSGLGAARVLLADLTARLLAAERSRRAEPPARRAAGTGGSGFRRRRADRAPASPPGAARGSPP